MKKLAILFALCASPAFGQSLPAFYGAEGGGALSVGGRGGTVCLVTSLADSGSGTLRECINTHNNTSDSRMTVVFRVGGTIEVKSEMAIWNPYITIAGQTAPGGGIQLTGKALCGDRGWDEMIRVRADHVIMRYLRMRKGACPEGSGTRRATLTFVSYFAKNVILDHLSMFWTEGTTSGVYGLDISGQSRENAPKNITFSNIILAEPLRILPADSGGGFRQFLTGAAQAAHAEGMTNIDVHNNLLATGHNRNPLLKHRSGRFVNNICYNWAWYAASVGPGVQVDFISNLYKAGPLTVAPSIMPDAREFNVFLYNADSCNFSGYMNLPPSLYVVGNKGPWITNPDADNWPHVKQQSCENAGIIGDLSRQYQRTTPLSATPVPITVRHVNNLESHLLPIVGAYQRLDCQGNWVSNRDAADSRVINEYNNNQGVIPAHENDVGGFPTIAGGTPCADADSDGMPDAWETANGLNPNNAADRNTLHSSGYTMLEMYLNGPMTGGLSTLTQPQNVRFSQ